MHKTKQVELSNENALKDLDLTVSIYVHSVIQKGLSNLHTQHHNIKVGR